MSEYTFPAVFHEEDNGTYSINFPDILAAWTVGENLADGITMAEDCLSLMLYEIRNRGEEMPKPSTEEFMKQCFSGDTIIMIDGDPDFYERYFAEYHPEESDE